MKIDKVIMSVDDNPLYSDFWLPVSKVWKLRFGIEPVLIYFGDKELDTTYGTVIKAAPSPNFPLYLQTQWARFWYTSKEPDSTFIISDIDMFPISRKHFLDQIKDVDSDKYVHLNGNVRPICVCYHVGKGSMFKKVLGLADSFEESMNDLWNSENTSTVAPHMGFNRWGLDESYSSKQIMTYDKPEDLVFLSDSEWNQKRIDRSNWRYNVDLLTKKDYYIDSHSIRPYAKYKSEIDFLVNLLTEEMINES